MDFLTMLSYAVPVLETAFLITALAYAARAIHEKKIKHKNQDKKGAKSSEIIEKVVSAHYRKACLFFMLYLLLNFFRRHSGLLG